MFHWLILTCMYCDLFHKRFMKLSVKSFENYLCPNFDYNYLIMLQFCTCHGSSAAMACAKFWHDLIIILCLRGKSIFFLWNFDYGFINNLWKGPLMCLTWKWVKCDLSSVWYSVGVDDSIIRQVVGHSISQPPVHPCFARAIELIAHPKITQILLFSWEFSSNVAFCTP